MIVIPGGLKGVQGLSKSKELEDILIKHQANNGLLRQYVQVPLFQESWASIRVLKQPATQDVKRIY